MLHYYRLDLAKLPIDITVTDDKIRNAAQWDEWSKPLPAWNYLPDGTKRDTAQLSPRECPRNAQKNAKMMSKQPRQFTKDLSPRITSVMNPNKLKRFWRYTGRTNQASEVEPDFVVHHFETPYGEFTALEIIYHKERTIDVYNVLDSWIGTFRSFEEALAYCSSQKAEFEIVLRIAERWRPWRAVLCRRRISASVYPSQKSVGDSGCRPVDVTEEWDGRLARQR